MIFSEKGIAPDPEKVANLKSARAPKDAEELRSLLGLALFVSGHFIGFSTITKVSWQLAKTERKKDFIWKTEHQNAFDELKSAITTKATAYYNPNWHTILVVDASSYGLGAVLVQQNPRNRKERVIVECCNRLLSKTECRYSQIEKEALSVVWACERLNMYLDSTPEPFKIITDNRAVELIYRNPLSKPPIRIQRWALRLSPFNYTIEHKSGKENCADYLSRTATTVPDEEISEESESLVNALVEELTRKTVTRAEIAN